MYSKTLKDFLVGSQVYHLSNHKLKMVVINIIESANKILCRWVDNDGKAQEMEFIPEELGIIDPNASTIRVGKYENKNRW